MMSGRRPGWFARVPAAALALTLCAGLLVPVYTDEVAWRFQMSRLVQDGWMDRGLSESCGPNASIVPPWFMWPVRLFSSAWTALWPSPLAVRIAGVLCALAALGLTVLLGRRLARAGAGAGDAGAIEAVAPALLGLGVLPFLLVWSRPEQPVLLMLLAAVWIALRPPGRRAAIALALIVGCAGVALSYQFKAVFYLPLFLWAVWMARGGRRVAPVLAALAVTAMAALAYRYWTTRFACPGDALIAARIARENAGATLIHANWGARLRAVPSLIADVDPMRYVRLTRPRGPFMSEWLPPPHAPGGVLKAWWLAVRVGWWLAALAGGAALARALADPAVRRARAPLIWLALLCIACPSAWALLQHNVNAYEATLYLPVGTIGIMAALAAGSGGRRWRTRQVVVVVALVSACSQVALLPTFAVPLWQAERGGGYLPGQPYSLSAFAWPRTRARILATGQLCDIPLRPTRLLVDDLTYFAYSGGPRPMHRLGVLSDWNGTIADPLRWMRARGSAGAVIGCGYLPPALRVRAHAAGDLCCLPAP